jgi:chromosome segregation ATPase
LLAASPLWNLVNPTALTTHDPPVINMKLGELRELMTPDGQGLADAFPELHLRDLPVFEWMPNKTLPNEWLNPVDAEMPEFVDYLPDSVGRTALQDIRLRDLMAVAKQKREVWSQHWQDAQTSLKSEDLAAEVEHLEARLKKATAEHDEAITKIQAFEAEHKSLVASMDLLEKKFNGDQDLIVHQEEEHAEGDAVRAALGKKVEEMDQGRKDLELKIAMTSAQLSTLKQQAAAMKLTADAKQHEIDEILAGKKAAEKALSAAKSDLAKDANLATELKEVKKEDAQLKTELNATLADEQAEAKANAALNSEVATLVAENRRLASVHLATLD